MEITAPAGMAAIGLIPAAPTECAPASITITARETAINPAIVPVTAIVPPMWHPRRDLIARQGFAVRFRVPFLRLPDGVRVPEYLS